MTDLCTVHLLINIPEKLSLSTGFIFRTYLKLYYGGGISSTVEKHPKWTGHFCGIAWATLQELDISDIPTLRHGHDLVHNRPQWPFDCQAPSPPTAGLGSCTTTAWPALKRSNSAAVAQGRCGPGGATRPWNLGQRQPGSAWWICKILATTSIL